MRWCGLIGAIALAACSEGTEEPIVTSAATEPLGTLTLRWTVAGSRDARACATASAPVIDVSIVSPDTGGELEAFQERCVTFATMAVLAPGTYAARVHLVDTSGDPRTPPVELPAFTLAEGGVIVQEVDFASFL
ncbi:MAG: hypothetical protein KIT84_37705 [Labilithrix sp.]|nr:hypothetical protein [Labilithrix sp.]